MPLTDGPTFSAADSFFKNSDKSWSYSEPEAGTMRFEVRGDDYFDSPIIPYESDDFALGKNRSELGSRKHMQFERAFVLEFDVKIESGAPNTADWMLLAQLHQTEDLNPDGTNLDAAASPPVALQMRGEFMEISGRTYAGFELQPSALNEAQWPPKIQLNGQDTMYLDTQPIVRDQWYTMRFELTFDPAVGGAGQMKVYRDGGLLVDYTGPLGYNDLVGPYLQMGVYRKQTSEAFAAQYRNVVWQGEGAPPEFNGTAGDDDIDAGLTGFWEAEVLNGGAGNDTLDGGVGADTLNGGAGNDIYVVDNAGDVVNERSGGVDQGGTDQVQAFVSWTLGADIENLILQGTDNINGTGNAGANVIQGNTGNNLLQGLGGNDSLLGDAGNDIVDGGAGDDKVFGAGGDDTVLGGDGNDELYGEDGNDRLNGGAGNDTLEGGAGNDTMAGGTGDDEYVVEQSGDVVIELAGGGSDTVRASVSFDVGAANEIEVINTVNQTATTAIDLSGSDGDNEIRGNEGANILRGRGGVDLLQGFGGNDSLDGGDGNDSLFGGAGNDTMAGGAGDDQYVVEQAGDVVIELAGGGNDTVRAAVSFDAGAANEIEFLSTTDESLAVALNISGTDSNNEIRGNNGVNELHGRGGDDLMLGYLGRDLMFGEAGNDTLFGGTNSDRLEGGAGDDSLEGEHGNDTLLGGDGTDVIFGGIGNDYIEGGEGNDSLEGQGDSDTIKGDAGADTISGGAGNDNLEGGLGDDSLQGNAGDDSIKGDAGTDLLYGGDGDDSLYGGDDADILRGEGGTDTLDGGAGNDTLYGGSATTVDNGGVMRGGSGDDTYFVEALNTTITELAGGGTDTVRTTVSLHLAAGNEVEVLRVDDQATTNAVNLTGSDSANELRGNDGSNILRGGAGVDTMFGFGGDDIFYVDDSNDVVIETAGGGNDTIFTTGSYTLGSTVFVETVQVIPSTSLTDVVLAGNDVANTLEAAGGNDSLQGRAGDDTLIGGDGDDTISGGDGTDTMVLDMNSTEVTATLGATSMTLQSLTGNDFIYNDVEFLQFADVTLTYDQASALVTTIELPSALAGDDLRIGTAGDDTLNGGGGADTLQGLGGADVLYGGNEFDTLEGGDGNDRLYSGIGAGNGAEMRGGAGDDTYFIDAAGSTITETAGEGTDTARISVSFSLAADNDIEVIRVYDQTTTDSLELGGSDIANEMRGNAGDNIFRGGAGNDSMYGYEGDDTYYVDDAGDQVVETEGNGRDTILTSINMQLGSTQYVEELRAQDETASTGMTLTGNQFDNVIAGTDGDDSLTGNAGNDTLIAHDGNDTLRGGDGSDEVVLDIASTEASGTIIGANLLLQTLAGDKLITDDVERVVFTDVTLTYEEASALIATISIPDDLSGDNDISGTAGADALDGGRGNDTLRGLAGDDTLRGSEGSDTLLGGDGNDLMYSGSAEDTANGGLMDGGAGNDNYYVDAANTTIVELAGGGSDTIRASVDITLSADAEVEEIRAQDDADITPLTFIGSNTVNTIRGNAGNNVLDGRGGADRMYGYGGDDTYYVDHSSDRTYEFAGNGQDTVISSISLSLRDEDDIEALYAADETSTASMTLIGNSLNNEIRGTRGAGSLRGGAGDDTLYGHTGDDTLYGDAGDDLAVLEVLSNEVTGSAGANNMLLYTLEGTLFVDNTVERIQFIDRTLTYAEVANLVSDVPIAGDPNGDNDISGTAGADVLRGNAGNDTLRGLGGNDTLYGDDGVDLLLGGDGNDELRGGSSDNPLNGGTMEGGAGDDSYYVEAANTIVTEAAGGGNDVVRTTVSIALAADSEVEEIRATSLNSTNTMNITGSDSNSTIRGNDGNNVLDGRGGADVMFGYAGDDIYIVDNAGDRVNEFDGNGTDTIRTSISYSLSSTQYIERLEAASSAALSLQGNQFNNIIVGGAGADSLRGQDGDDTLIGLGGEDTVYGGAGTDSVVFSLSSTDVTATRGGSSMILLSVEGNEFISNDVEFFVFADQTLTYEEASTLVATVAIPGDPTGDNYFVGGIGNDTINGGPGNDTLDGAAGNDILRGDEGVDSLIGGTGNDTLFSGSSDNPADGGTMEGGTGDDIYYVDAANSTVTEAAGAGNDMIRTTVDVVLAAGSEVEEIRAANLAGTLGLNITGSDSANLIRGDAGNNVLDGRGGADTMYGYEGDDLYRIDDVNDTVIEVNGNDTVEASINLTLGSTWGVEVLRAIGGSGLTLQGNQFDNRIEGDGGADWLLGNAGNDTLVGGAGDDTLYGGTGTDTVIFDLASTDVSVAAGGTSFVMTSGLGVDFINNDVEFVQFTDGTLTYAQAAALVPATPTITGTNATENINGTSAAEIINALDGWDWITPGGGNDTIDGGPGTDMVSFVNLPDTPGRTNVQYRLDIDLTAGTAHSHDNSEIMQILNVERVTGTIFADKIKGTAGDNQLRALGDYDWFTATTGNDTMDGGNGKDMISYVEWQNTAANLAENVFSDSGAPPASGGVTGVVVDLNNTANNTHLAAGHTYISIERITGSGRQDVFWGDGNSNDFRGLGDYDWFVGSTGGRERYFGGDGLDTVTYFQSGSGVSASLRNGAVVDGAVSGRGTAGDAALDLYFSIENLVGTTHADELTGNNERNMLSGLAGDDMIFGFGGIDQLKGGAGNDTIDGGGSSDYAIFSGNSVDYTLTRTSATEVTVDGADGTDSLINVEYFRFDDADLQIWDLVIV